MNIFSRINFLFLLIFSVTSKFVFSESLPTHVPENSWTQICQRMIKPSSSYSQTRAEQLQLCCANALFLHGSSEPLISEELLQTLESLHVFSDVIPTISKTNLLCSQFIIARNFTHITDNIETLEARQKLLSYLNQNPELKISLDKEVKKIVECEDIILVHFYPTPKKNAAETESSFLENSINFISSANQAMEGAAHTVGCRRFYLEAQHRMLQFTMLMAIKYYSESLWIHQKALRDPNTYALDQWDSYRNSNQTFDEKIRAWSNNRQMQAFQGAVTSVSTIYTFSKGLRSHFLMIYAQQKQLMELYKLVESAQKMHELLKQHSEIANLIPGHEKIAQLAMHTEDSSKISTDLKFFLKLLDSPSFKGSPSFYFSFQGKITEAYNEFAKIKHELIPFIEAFGDIEAQLWAASLLERTDAQFCIPTWIKSDQPVLENIDFWHPIINPEKVVKNSMHVGGKAKATNVVVTGANAGGKTTSLTAIMLGQIMAQSLGIAPSKALRSTPFAKFHTYLDISTNLANNESLFMAQANRAAKLQNSICSCTAGQKSLSLLDEIFTGTRADFAEKASYSFAKNLGENKHSICLLATHFPKLTELEKLKTFINYKTQDATITPQGDLVYPYKIIPGISEQNIAQHILQQKGILKKA